MNDRASTSHTLGLDGTTLHTFDLEQAHDRATEQLTAIPEAWRHPDGLEQPPRPRHSKALDALAAEVRERETTQRT